MQIIARNSNKIIEILKFSFYQLYLILQMKVSKSWCVI